MKRDAFAISILVFLVYLNAYIGPAKRTAEWQTAVFPPRQSSQRNAAKLIHVLVALCDNESQGIVPVPAKIGSGSNAALRLFSSGW